LPGRPGRVEVADQLVKRLGELVNQFDQMPDGPQKTAGKELIQLLMDVHGQGLERMMEIIFESGEAGSSLIDQLGKDEIAGEMDGALKVRLRAPAVEDRANEALVEFLAGLLKTSRSAVSILSGERSRVKRIEIRGVTRQQVLNLLVHEA
jgi:uncharacterized protein (TIGR00251 family)